MIVGTDPYERKVRNENSPSLSRFTDFPWSMGTSRVEPEKTMEVKALLIMGGVCIILLLSLVLL